MSFDDDLRERMRRAATEVGRGADPAAATARLAAATASTGASLSVVAKIAGVLAVAGVAAGAILGATVMRPEAAVDAAAAGVASHPGATFDCPGGRAVGQLQPGDRVYVVGSDGTDEWSAIRDPDGGHAPVWVPASALVPDAPPTADHPVIDCDDEELVPIEATIPTDTTEPTETSAVEGTVVETSFPTNTAPEANGSETTSPPPTTQPGPPPATPAPPTQPPVTTTPAATPTTTPPTTAAPTTAPPDTVPPTISVAVVLPHTGPNGPFIYYAFCSTETGQVTVTASDDVGVVSVTGSATHGTLTAFQPTGPGQWTSTFSPTALSPAASITVVVRDAARNAATASRPVRIEETLC